ncbi:hypothetical protein C4B68_40750 (plasmid) [Streptomyces dengpaensis]|uniref:DUF6919 domain-containing protein n=2 Tax=Streptomyces TaxID=1883 RepID=A0ABN5IFU2_9ACTN|nr:hypothetical protein C4B68_40750 [Streptomyces dengpaensis]PIB04540.1 hypothetical protein B1C81_32720 [Streptomyces sp. HG99]
MTAVDIKLPWMSRSDRRRWRSARTISDLSELMALWLEGKIASRPGYQPRYGPDDETAHLVPSLAALCRAGYVTTCSQPGFAGTGADGLWWEQRAAVELVVTDPTLFHRLVDAAYAAGLFVRINDYRPDGGVQEEPVVATTRDGEAMTAFGGRISRADMAIQWPGLDRDLYREVSTGTYVSIIAPEYGTPGERLWVTLDFLTGQRQHDPENPWASSTRPADSASR